MFSQISLRKQDRRFHRFLWRDLELEKQPRTYESTRLVFGDTASPFLAQKVLLYHAGKHRQRFPEASHVIESDIYIDDIMTGAETEEEAAELLNQLQLFLQEGGFRIRRWCSNSAQVLDGVPTEDRVSFLGPKDGTQLPTMKTLGLTWNAHQDVFSFNSTVPYESTCTKRSVLSRVAAVYDPLGILAPFVVRAKIGIQMCWRSGVGWDDPLPDTLATSWRIWIEELKQLDLAVRRCYREEKKTPVDAAVHTFTDASEKAYGAVSYLRLSYADGTVSVSFIAAKTRVTPLRAVSLPRLELLGAHLGMQLSMKVGASLSLPVQQHVFWTDSMNTLYWVRGDSRRFKSFVANRVGDIQTKICPSQWRHVPGLQNPADDCSRGLSVKEMTADSRWINGPPFLHQSPENWPKTPISSPSEDAKKEERKVVMSFPARSDEPLLQIDAFSSWNRLVAVTAWVRRFVRNCRTVKSERSTGELTLAELEKAQEVWLKRAQEECFREELTALEENKELSKQSRLRELLPRMSESGLMRVGGRLDKADVPESAKHPIILPKKHPVTTLLIREAHERLHHSGINHVLADTRTRYWIVNGRQAVKDFDRKCSFCVKRRAKPATQVMAPLPESRVGATLRAFEDCGVDLFGPFFTKVTRRVTAKRFGCIFTCMSTRAVHIEMTTSMDAESFLQAFSRMVARRGCPVTVTSDNGTNFKRADRELSELYQKMDRGQIDRHMARKGIKWIWNPPQSPHHGGVFEALIKSAKRALRAAIGSRMLNDEELQTVFAETESLLNSRPLTYPSSDPRDDGPLTPNHFLVGQMGGTVAPELPASELNSPGRRWRHTQRVLSKVWKRFLQEILPNLNKLHKWRDVKPDIKDGDVVLVVDNTSPRGHWPLARVERTYPGSDGHVRTVDIRLGDRTYTRSITRLCPLRQSD